MTVEVYKKYSLGDYELDPANHLLMRGETPVSLSRKRFQVLLYLIEHQGRLVTREELLARFWDGSEVYEENLTKCVSEIRKALADQTKPHQFIETVPGVGYRYIGPFAAEPLRPEPSIFAIEKTRGVRVIVEEDESHDGALIGDKPLTHQLPTETVIGALESRQVLGRLRATGGTKLLTADVSSAVTRPSKRAVTFVLTAFVVAVAGLSYFFVVRSSKTSINSVAVLPFVNETKDSNTEYLSDGISEALINNLSRLPQLKVIARTSTFKYKGKEVEPKEVAKSLGVGAIVTGRIVQRGDDLQISVELMNANEGTQIWGEQYNRKASDLLALQGEISREIAETLRKQLTIGERQQLAKRETVNPQAYELVLRGRFYSRKGGVENAKKALDYFNQAVSLDGSYALAYAELSMRYTSLVVADVLDPKEFMPKAEAAARRALELDDTLAEAHNAMAGIELSAWDWTGEERELKRAIDLNPNLARVRADYSFYLSIMGRHDEAIAEGKRARELDPLNLATLLNTGYRLLLGRQYDQALEIAKDTIELDQDRPGAHVFLGYVYTAKGLFPEAISEFQKAIKLGDNSSDTQIDLGVAYASAGELENARMILKQLQITKEYVSPGALAQLYGALGEREQAFALLERAYAEHDPQLQLLRVDPDYDPLRSDPRFGDLMRRVGLK